MNPLQVIGYDGYQSTLQLLVCDDPAAIAAYKSRMELVIDTIPEELPSIKVRSSARPLRLPPLRRRPAALPPLSFSLLFVSCSTSLGCCLSCPATSPPKCPECANFLSLLTSHHFTVVSFSLFSHLVGVHCRQVPSPLTLTEMQLISTDSLLTTSHQPLPLPSTNPSTRCLYRGRR